jgi:hypothetical protein
MPPLTHMSSNSGYGASPRCSPLQQEWQIQHPTFRAIETGLTIKDVLNKSPLIPLIADPSILLPLSTPSLYKDEPSLIDYVQLPLHLWVPDFFVPHLVPFMPCPEAACTARTARQRWHSGGPRLIHDIDSAAYLHCWEYQCDTHRKKSFSGWDQRCLAKLAPSARALFRFVLSKEEGVSVVLHRRVVEARVSGSSLNALRNELVRNRYTRMYEKIAAYYQHCKHHRMTGTTGITPWLFGRGASTTYAPLPPIIHNESGYYDHEPPSITYFSELYQLHCQEQSTLWTRYTQQLTAERAICIDATFKLAKKVVNTSAKMLWSMMDIDTGCVLHQQLLTHERHDDILPMMASYADRCREMGVSLPRRVCSDRGLMDANVINDPTAFPDAHVNIDPWHLHALFAKTLNKNCSTWKDVARQFSAAMYVEVTGADGVCTRTHAEPQAIVSTVDALIAHFSHSGSGSQSAITQTTKTWWQERRITILERRLCSHPIGETSMLRVSSSPLENFHRQINRLFKLVRCSESTVHAFLLQFMYKWNVDRRRAAGKETDWKIYEMQVLDYAYQSCVAVLGNVDAGTMWHGGFKLPPPRATQEQFGFMHNHITLQARRSAADHHLPFADRLLTFLSDKAASLDPLLSTSQVQLLCASAATLTPSDASTSTPIDDVYVPIPPLPIVSFTPPAPIKRMSLVELQLLSDMQRVDVLMRDAINAEEWDNAAARWNSFLREAGERRETREAVRHLHGVHGEIIRAGVTINARRQEQQREVDIINMKASGPKVPWTVVPPSRVQFSMYEDTVLMRLVEKNSKGKGAKKIDWTTVVSAWLTQYRAEYIAGQNNRLQCRSKEVIKSHYQSLSTRAAPPPPPPLPSTIIIPAPSVSLSEPLTSLPAPPTSSTPPPCPASTTADPLGIPLPSSITTSPMKSIVDCGRFIARQLFAPPTTPTPLPPPLTHYQPHPSPTTSSCNVVGGVSDVHKYHWSEDATAHFNQLIAERNNRITYKEFTALWPTSLFGPVDSQRFINKKKIEKRKREQEMSGGGSKKKATAAREKRARGAY